MAGRVVNVIPRTAFSFNNATNTSSTQVLGPRSISTPDWTNGVLLVRVHAATIVTNASVTIAVKNVSITAEDPNVLFLDSGTVASIALAPSAPVGNASGSLVSDSFSEPVGSMVAVYMTMAQGATSGAVTFEISVDLVGRDS